MKKAARPTPVARAPHPRRGTSRPRAAAAFRELLAALGVDPKGELRDTPERAATMWLDHLMAGECADLAAVVGRGTATRSQAPVSLFDLGVHLVCPHHLTVAFGRAHIAYVPGGRIAGFGALARLVAACSARLELQENVTTAIAEALVEHLGARAAIAVIEATHPCHNVLQPRSHAARAVTWAAVGEPAGKRHLRRALELALAGHAPAPRVHRARLKAPR
jgi:GTP cyclohydrolase IA